MDRRLAIFSALGLAAVLAGLLWYQLVRSPEGAQQPIALTTSPTPTPAEWTTPEASPAGGVIAIPEESPLISTAPAPTALPVEPSAKTGFNAMSVTIGFLLTGLSGLAVTARRLWPRAA